MRNIIFYLLLLFEANVAGSAPLLLEENPPDAFPLLLDERPSPDQETYSSEMKEHERVWARDKTGDIKKYYPAYQDRKWDRVWTKNQGGSWREREENYKVNLTFEHPKRYAAWAQKLPYYKDLFPFLPSQDVLKRDDLNGLLGLLRYRKVSG